MAKPVLVQKTALDDYELTECLGSGSSAVVWKATHKRDGALYAIKQFSDHTLSSSSRPRLQTEINILSRITHPNIVRLFDVLKDDVCTCLVMEYCAGGDLATYIKKQGKVGEAVARGLMKQLGAGLQMLRSINLIHRDLKPENLLLSAPGKDAVLKISDFGLARELEPGAYTDTVCGTPLYMAPEVLQFQKYDSKADLWSVGAILFQLLTGDTPYHGTNNFQVLQSIKSSNLRFPETMITELHPHCIDLCQRLLCCDPGKRLVFKEFINHKFFDLL